MERHKFTNESICLFDLNIQNPLVVQALSLNHLPVVDADSQQDGVHDLTKDELNDLVLEPIGHDEDDNDPGNYVEGVGDYEVP